MRAADAHRKGGEKKGNRHVSLAYASNPTRLPSLRYHNFSIPWFADLSVARFPSFVIDLETVSIGEKNLSGRKSSSINFIAIIRTDCHHR